MVNNTGIPSSVKTPFFYLNVCDGTLAIPEVNCEILFLGPMQPAADAIPDKRVLVTSLEEAGRLFGNSSILYDMFRIYFQNPLVGAAYAQPFVAVGGQTEATATLTVVGTATANGTLAFKMSGKRYEAIIANGDTPTAIATKIASAVTADAHKVVSAVAALGVVTLTAILSGILGNQNSIIVSPNETDALPEGVTSVTPTAFAGGAGEPDLGTKLALIGDCPFTCVVSPYNSEANVDDLCDFFNCSTGRWSWRRMLYGIGFLSFSGTAGELVTKGNLSNCMLISAMGMCENVGEIEWQWAAAYGAAMCQKACEDPASSFNNVQMWGIGCETECSSQCFTYDEREIIASNGVSTWECSAGGIPRVDLAITNLQELSNGVRVYQPLQYMFIHQYLAKQLIDFAKLTWDGKKIADNGTSLARSSKTLTPDLMKAQLVSWAKDFEGELIEDIDGFENSLIIERDPANPTRVNIYMFVNPVDPQLIVATKFSLVSNYKTIQ